MEPDLWARIVYDLAVTFNCWTGNTHKLIDLSTPLYFGNIASLANRTVDLDYASAERVFVDIVRAFENEKVYLTERWGKLGAGEICSM
jgi:hypothetical protein